jgi:thiosulfate reductase cytochrome b subunit
MGSGKGIWRGKAEVNLYCKTDTMKAATERKIMRWVHIITSIPIIGLIYGPVKDIPQAVAFIQWVLFPIIVLSGLWMWKGHVVRKWFRKKRYVNQ